MVLDLTTPASTDDSLKKGNSDAVASGRKVSRPHVSEDDDEDPEASRPIASIDTPISDEVNPEESPVQNRGRSNSITAEDLARDVAASAAHSSVTGSIDGPKKIKRKKKKASQRMRPKSHSPQRAAAQTDGKPLMDLRQILKKHEKKSETKEMYDDNDSVSSDFYGSLSSIPFLHPEKEEKKQRKGRRTKKKEPSSTSDKKSNSPKTPKKEATKIEVTKEYTDADVQLWKSMSAFDGSYMEEASHRPDHMFPITDPSSPQKEVEKKAPPSPTRHNERGFHRPDDWVECDHPNKRNPKKKTYQTKHEDESDQTEEPANTECSPSSGERKAVVETTVSEECEHKSIDEVRNEESKKPIAMDHVAVPPKTNSSKSTKQKKHKKTCLAITFQDGCVISGDFRPKEKVERVIRDLKQDLLRTDASLPDFDLLKNNSDSNEKELLDPKVTLQELCLVPSGEVFVHWRGSVDETKEPGWYLNSGDE